MSEEDARVGLEALESFTALSLDAELPGSEDGYSLGDAIGGPDPPSTPSSTGRRSRNAWPPCPNANGPSSTCASSTT